MKKYLLLGILAILVIIPLGCSGGYGPIKTTTTTVPAGTNAVTISNFSFSPATLTVNVGTKVTWTNKDATTHTVTSDTGVFNSGDLARNASFSYTFGTAGTYAYHCSIHTNMTGTIVVK